MAELTRRYIVMTMSAEGPFDPEDPEASFVLKPWKDPAALRALEAYRAHCYPELAEELGRWIATIRQGPVVRGGVGGQNERYVAERDRARLHAPKRARPAARRGTRPQARRQVAKAKPLSRRLKSRSKRRR